jgi:Ca-activated chloride channel homolog
MKIYTVGVGTPAGELIPVAPDQGGGFVKDDAGALVKSRLDEAALKAIAAASGGIYAPLGTQGEGLESIFKAIFGNRGKHDLAFRRRKVYIERYQWPLAGSVGLLFASLLIGTRRRRRRAGVAGAAVVSMPEPAPARPAADRRGPLRRHEPDQRRGERRRRLPIGSIS